MKTLSALVLDWANPGVEYNHKDKVFTVPLSIMRTINSHFGANDFNVDNREDAVIVLGKKNCVLFRENKLASNQHFQVFFPDPSESVQVPECDGYSLYIDKTR